VRLKDLKVCLTLKSQNEEKSTRLINKIENFFKVQKWPKLWQKFKNKAFAKIFY
jgi:hypothetical protein